MPSVAIIFRKDKLNKRHEAPIHLRIIKDRKISYISTGTMLNEKFWDEKNKRVRSSYPNSARLNSYLSNKFTELQDEIFEHETVLKSLTSRNLKDRVFGKKPTDFFAFAGEVIEKYLKENRINTYDKSKSIINRLSQYLNGSQISFQDITPEFLEKYEDYMRTEWHNKPNTIHTSLKFIRKLFNDAFRRGLIENAQNPFLIYRLKQEKTQRDYLSEEELSRIEKLKLTKGTRMELHRDMFVFACYAGGLRVSDTLKLQWSDFDGKYINFTIRKTGQQLSINLPNKALDIVNRYKSDKINKSLFVFPIFSNDLNLNDFRAIDTAISNATAYINKNLKTIAEKAGIKKRLSFHVSRHTWATQALRKGISIDKVSKLMGHAAIAETQIYAKIMSQELDKAMEAFN
jgi:integrase/recombinase XerD